MERKSLLAPEVIDIKYSEYLMGLFRGSDCYCLDMSKNRSVDSAFIATVITLVRDYGRDRLSVVPSDAFLGLAKFYKMGQDMDRLFNLRR